MSYEERQAVEEEQRREQLTYLDCRCGGEDTGVHFGFCPRCGYSDASEDYAAEQGW